jgi:hypothetical protein
VKASNDVRTAGALGHLLLVVVLALGVCIMHTLGHPAEPSGSAMSTSSHAATMDTAPAPHDPMNARGVTDAVGRAADPVHSPVTHQPAMAMDMVSLCMAVLFGAWVLAALLKSAFARHEGWLAALLARVAAVRRTDRPPRGPDLTLLSVLRL